MMVTARRGRSGGADCELSRAALLPCQEEAKDNRSHDAEDNRCHDTMRFRGAVAGAVIISTPIDLGKEHQPVQAHPPENDQQKKPEATRIHSAIRSRIKLGAEIDRDGKTPQISIPSRRETLGSWRRSMNGWMVTGSI